jgi:hypothetical protein
MFSFLKRRIPAAELAEGFFISLQQRAEMGLKERVLPLGESLAPEILESEWIFLDVFTFDYATFLVFGDAPVRHAILRPYGTLLRSWLALRQAPATPVRTTLYLFPNEMTTLFPEEAEPGDHRFERRLALYQKAIKNPNDQGENWSVGVAFSMFCGVHEISYAVAISAYFSHMKIEDGKTLKSVRIE